MFRLTVSVKRGNQYMYGGLILETWENVHLKIVKSTLFKRVLTKVSAMLPSSGYLKTLLNSADFTIFKLTLSNYASQGFYSLLHMGKCPFSVLTGVRTKCVTHRQRKLSVICQCPY